MQIDLSPLIPYGIGILVLFFGYGFGLFEGRGQGYKRRKQEEAEEQKTKGPQTPPPSAPVPMVDNSLLKLGLDENNQPRLDLDGQRVDTSQLTPDQRKRLIDLMVTMRPWVDAAGAKPAAPAPSHSIAAQTPSLSKPSPDSGTMQAPPSAAPVPPQPKPTPAAASTTPSKEEAAPSTMVGQIDAILQKNLASTPLASLGVRLMESQNGGVTVMVGMNQYSGVGDVPDPQVQAAIRAAIAEWEKKYTPGG
jgi:hypothetical protein